MSAQLFTALPRATGLNGQVLSGAQWKFYNAETSTPLAVYADADLTVPLGTTVTADIGGLFPTIYFDNATAPRAVLCDQYGATIDEIDAIPAEAGGIAGSGSFFADSTPPARLVRLGDRAFGDEATAQTGEANDPDASWLATSSFCAGGSGYSGSGWDLAQNATWCVVSSGRNTILAATRRHDGLAAAAQVPEAGAFLFENQATGAGFGTGWGVYVDARRRYGAGVTFAYEGDIANMGAGAANTPFSPNVADASVCFQAASGSQMSFIGQGYISGTTLTITSVNAASIVPIKIGMHLIGNGLTSCFISALGTGTGGTGTYSVDVSQTWSSAMSPGGLVITYLSPATAAFNITTNGSTFYAGINFDAQAIEGTLGLSGYGPAVQMANYQGLDWSNSSGDKVAKVYSTTTLSANARSILFSDSGVGIYHGGNSFPDVLMQTASSSTCQVKLFGGTTSATIGTANVAASGGVGLVLDTQGHASIFAGGAVVPGADNTYTIGANGARWSAVWAANGTIQTSDPALKTDIADLPEALPLVAAITPKTYRWKCGGSDVVTRTELHEVPVMEAVVEDYEAHELQEDGTWRVVTKQRERQQEVIDLHPVLDADGNQIIDLIHHHNKALKQTFIEERPRFHGVPRMELREVEVSELVEREGRRTHWGFLATDVAEAFAATGRDFAGYVEGEDGTRGLRMDQLVPVLWKAVQELACRVEALEAGQ